MHVCVYTFWGVGEVQIQTLKQVGVQVGVQTLTN